VGVFTLLLHWSRLAVSGPAFFNLLTQRERSIDLPTQGSITMEKSTKKVIMKEGKTITPGMYDCCWYEPPCNSLCCGGVCCNSQLEGSLVLQKGGDKSGKSRKQKFEQAG
jgi:hypothetical protein